MPQGLSDFRGAELPALGGLIEDRCPLYDLKKDDSVPGGAPPSAPPRTHLTTHAMWNVTYNHVFSVFQLDYILNILYPYQLSKFISRHGSSHKARNPVLRSSLCNSQRILR